MQIRTFVVFLVSQWLRWCEKIGCIVIVRLSISDPLSLGFLPSVPFSTHQQCSGDHKILCYSCRAKRRVKREKENPNVAERIVRVWVAHFRLHTYIVSQPIYILCVFFGSSPLSLARAQHTTRSATSLIPIQHRIQTYTQYIRPRVCDMTLQSQLLFFSALCVRTLYFLFILVCASFQFLFGFSRSCQCLAAFFFIFALSSFVRHTTTAAG